MTTLKFDPAENEEFLKKIAQLSGYPAGETIPIQQMLFESDVLFSLPETLVNLGITRQQNLLVIMDSTPMRRGEESLKPLALKILKQAGYSLHPLVLTPDATGQVHTEMSRINAIRSRLSPEAALLSIGSGTVTDIAKHAAFLYEQQSGIHIPYLCYQTANSVTAFTSNMAPIFIEGVKRTVASRYPDALVCDLETLRDAPQEMTVAGVGDLLALYTAYPDWYLASCLGMDDSYNDLPRLLIDPLDEHLLAWAPQIKQPTLEGMKILAKLISLVGLGLSIFHATTPLSGYEHVLSHTLDMLSEARQRPLPLHGSQAAMAVLLLSPIYNIFLQEFDPLSVDVEQCFPGREEMEQHIKGTFLAVDPDGRAGMECWEDYQVKLERWNNQRDNLSSFLESWEHHQASLQMLTRPPERIMQILHAVGSPLWFDELTPPLNEEDIRFAFLNAPLIRRRLTLGDLLLFFEWDRDELFERAWEEGLILVDQFNRKWI